MSAIQHAWKPALRLGKAPSSCVAQRAGIVCPGHVRKWLPGSLTTGPICQEKNEIALREPKARQPEAENRSGVKVPDQPGA
jgi:hypothetical protein